MPTHPRNLLATTVLGLLLIGVLALVPVSRLGADDLPFTAVWPAMPDCLTVPNIVVNGCSYDKACVFNGKLADGRLVFSALKPGESEYRSLRFDPQGNS